MAVFLFYRIHKFDSYVIAFFLFLFFLSFFFYLNTRNLIKIIRQDFIRNEENLRNYRRNEMCSAIVLDANGCDITIIEHINTRSMYVNYKAVPRKTRCY